MKPMVTPDQCPRRTGFPISFLSCKKSAPADNLLLSSLPHTQYAENHATIGPAVQPTFVEILKGSLPEQDALAKEAEHIAQIVSARLSRPIENTHVLYLPAGIGRIAFGGNLVRA